VERATARAGPAEQLEPDVGMVKIAARHVANARLAESKPFYWSEERVKKGLLEAKHREGAKVLSSRQKLLRYHAFDVHFTERIRCVLGDIQ